MRATRRSSEEDVCGRGAKTIPFAQVPPTTALDYAGERADLALQLADTLQGLLRKEHLEGVYRGSRACR